jgi:hypothetical protein
MLNFDRKEPNPPMWGGLRRPKLIGILGKAGAGKDTVRGILEAEHAYTGLAFADPMREMLQRLFDVAKLPDQYRTSRTLKETPLPELQISYRQMMQKLGTEWGRSLKEDLWVRLAKSRVEADSSKNYCISDVRFKNEAAWIKNQGGVLWRVERPNVDSVQLHVSEVEADDIQVDVTVPNIGSLAELSAIVGTILKLA